MRSDSVPRHASSRVERRVRSFEMYRLCFLVFQPGAGPTAGRIEALPLGRPVAVAVFSLYHYRQLEKEKRRKKAPTQLSSPN